MDYVGQSECAMTAFAFGTWNELQYAFDGYVTVRFELAGRKRLKIFYKD